MTLSTVAPMASVTDRYILTVPDDAPFTAAQLDEFERTVAAWPVTLGEFGQPVAPDLAAYAAAESLILFGVPAARAYGMCWAHQVALGELYPAVAYCRNCAGAIHYADEPDATPFERRHGLTRRYRHLDTGAVDCTRTNALARFTCAALPAAHIVTEN